MASPASDSKPPGGQEEEAPCYENAAKALLGQCSGKAAGDNNFARDAKLPYSRVSNKTSGQEVAKPSFPRQVIKKYLPNI